MEATESKKKMLKKIVATLKNASQELKNATKIALSPNMETIHLTFAHKFIFPHNMSSKKFLFTAHVFLTYVDINSMTCLVYFHIKRVMQKILIICSPLYNTKGSP